MFADPLAMTTAVVALERENRMLNWLKRMWHAESDQSVDSDTMYRVLMGEIIGMEG